MFHDQPEDVFWSVNKDGVESAELCALVDNRFELVVHGQKNDASIVLTLADLRSMVEAIEDETHGLA